MRVFKNILLCLLMAGLFFSCSGDGSKQAGGDQSTITGFSKKVLSEDLQITTDTNDQSNPSIAYDSVYNKYLIVWVDSRNSLTNGTDIYGKICDSADITACTTATEISISTATGDQSQPKVAFDKDNQKYLVVWTDSQNSGYSQIYGQYVNTDGTPNGSITAITRHDDPATFNPYDEVGNATVTQTDDDTLLHYTSQSNADLIYDETLRRFVISWLDTSDSDTVHTITITPSECNNSVNITYIRLLDGADYNLIRTGEINGANPLTMASNLQDYSALAFTAPFLAKDGKITASFELQVDETRPKLLYDKTTGNYYITVQGRTNAVDLSEDYVTEAIIGTETQYESPPGGTWDAGESFTVTSGSGDNITAVLIYLPNGDAVTGTVISGLGTSSISVMLQSTSNAVGTTANLTVVLTTDGGNQCDYKEVVYTSTDLDSGTQKIKVRKLTEVGGESFVEDLSFGTKNSYNAAVTTDPNTTRALMDWEEMGTSDKEIYGQLIDLSNFSIYSTQINVSNAQGDQTQPIVSFDNVNQRYLVVWEDARNQSVNISNMDIYGQFIDPQGNLSGSNFAVTDSSGNQLAPALTFGDVDYRKFFIVWKDGTDPSNSDIYGQLWEYSVAPQLVVTDETDTPIYNSAIDFGGVRLSQSSTKNFRIWNNGNAQLTITEITDPTAPFSLTTPKPTTINPGTYYQMVVQFSPTTTGSFNSQFSINSDGGATTIYLSGSGSTPDIDVTNTGGIDFGNVIAGETGDKSFTISNVGNDTLTINSITTTSPFSIVGGTFPLTISAGGSTTVTVRFSPTEAKTYSAKASISSDDPDEALIEIPLTGSAVETTGTTTTTTDEGGGTTTTTGTTTGAGGSISSSGGCSIGGRQNKPTAIADTAIMLIPMFVV
ncbi:MAG: choice-of-anchor D domain-containing protein, partial [Nitrospirae bacterium]|nr:choice-of-anchor D domain-containing protein [Nitrospirota bacterium]